VGTKQFAVQLETVYQQVISAKEKYEAKTSSANTAVHNKPRYVPRV
jgi:hypothetical protein